MFRAFSPFRFSRITHSPARGETSTLSDYKIYLRFRSFARKKWIPAPRKVSLTGLPRQPDLKAEEKWAAAEENLGQRQVCCLSLFCVQRPGARTVDPNCGGVICLAAWERKEGVGHANKEWGSHPQQMPMGQRVGMGRRKEMSHRSRQRGSQDTGILGHLVDSWLVSHTGDGLKGMLVPTGVCATREKNTTLQVRGQLPCTHTCMCARSHSPRFPRKTAGDKGRTHSSRRQK